MLKVGLTGARSELQLAAASLALSLAACQTASSTGPASGPAGSSSGPATSSAGSQPAPTGGPSGTTDAAAGRAFINGQRPVVGVATFTGADDQEGWLGFLIADHVTRRLLVTGTDASYPADVFAWRQTRSAARAAGLSPNDVAAAHETMLRELGADRLVTGSYAIDGNEVVLRWQLAGSADATTQQRRVKLSEVSAAAYAIGTEVLTQLGRAGGEAPQALPGTAVQGWGSALAILSRQSQDARARAVLKKAERIKARVELTSVTTAAPTFGPAWALRAVVEILDNDLDAATDALKKAEALVETGDPDAALARYYVLDQDSFFTDSQNALEMAVKTHPGALQVLGYLGDAYYGYGDYEKALVAFTKYLDRVPSSPYAARRRDAVLARLGRKEEALKNASALFKKYPNSVTVLAALASRQIDAGQLDEARKTLQQGLDLMPDHPLLLTRLSFVELEAGDAKKALALAEKAVKMVGEGRGKKNAGYAYIDLARAQAIAGRSKEAKSNLIKAIHLGIDAGDIERLRRDPRLKNLLPEGTIRVRQPDE